jgi:hypothetical protein
MSDFLEHVCIWGGVKFGKILCPTMFVDDVYQGFIITVYCYFCGHPITCYSNLPYKVNALTIPKASQRYEGYDANSDASRIIVCVMIVPLMLNAVSNPAISSLNPPS